MNTQVTRKKKNFISLCFKRTSIVFYHMFLLVRLVPSSNIYYWLSFHFQHFDRSEERCDRAKISLVFQHNQQQSQILSPAIQGCALLVPCANIIMYSVLSGHLLMSLSMNWLNITWVILLTFVVKLKICLARTSAINAIFRSSLVSLSGDLTEERKNSPKIY